MPFLSRPLGRISQKTRCKSSTRPPQECLPDSEDIFALKLCARFHHITLTAHTSSHNSFLATASARFRFHFLKNCHLTFSSRVFRRSYKAIGISLSNIIFIILYVKNAQIYTIVGRNASKVHQHYLRLHNFFILH